jgi:hypothetical protein
MKIIICICFSKKNSSYHPKILKNLNEINIPFNCKLSFYLISNGNFKNLNDLVLRIMKNSKLDIKIIKTIKKDIPSTRNIFLNKIKKKKINYVGFLDDDCKIKRNWVVDMVKFIKNNNCDIVGGPQLHETTTDKYKSFYKFMEPKYNHKQKVNWIATNNCLFKKAIINQVNLRFDVNLKNIGGSDQLFFTKLKVAKYRIMWNAKTEVIEYYQKDRENFNWFIMRNFRYGFSGLIIDKKIFGKKIGHGINLLKIIYLIILGMYQLIQIFKSYNISKSLFYFSRASGRISSITKFRMTKYH